MEKEVKERRYGNVFEKPKVELSAVERLGLLEKSEIGLMIDSYDDIFSDFDPRPYTHRSLSVDFLDEVKRAVLGKPSDEIDVVFLIAAKKRNYELEHHIRRRLREHFHKHYELIRKEKTDVLRKGIIMMVIGAILMMASTYVLFKTHNGSLLTSFLITLLEPSGWFLFWEGMNYLLLETRHKKPELEFYEKMSRAGIEFLSHK